MKLEIIKNMCRICMKTNDGLSIYSVLDTGIIKKFQFCTQLEISKTDDLPIIICNKCVGRLEIAYDFCKQAECSDKYLRRVIAHHNAKMNQSALGEQGTRINVEQDNKIEQLTNFELEEVSIVNIPPTLEEVINCKGTERLTDSVSMYSVVGECSAADKVKIEEADIEKIQDTKQTNVFTIAKVTSIPKTEFNQTNEITGNESCSQEDIDSLSDDDHQSKTQIKVKQGVQMQQPIDVISGTISDATEEGIQYKESTCGTNIAKIGELQETIFTITKVTSIRKNEDGQTEKFECIECGIHFTRKRYLKRHSLIHSDERQSGISRKKRISKRNKSQIHLVERSYQSKGGDQTGKFVCMVCGKRFTINSSLTRHSLTHSGVRKYKCNLCSRSFALSYNLASHKRLHTRDRPYTCETCGLHFRSKKILKQHVFIKHESQKKDEMEINGVKIQETKPTSIRKNDKPIGKFECIECGVHFKRKSHLNSHSLIHSGERPHKCNICDQSFAHKCNLTSHLLRHSDEKPYTCEICGFPFRHQNSLKRHTFTKHKKQKKAEVKRIVLKQSDKMECILCGAHFKTKRNLNRHSLIHSDECQSGISRKRRISKRNKSQIHLAKPINDITITEVTSIRKNDDSQTGEITGKFECIECGDHFKRKSHLNSHSLIHSGERPHKCNICDQSFAHKCNLTSHLLRHSDEKPYTCETCGFPFRHQNSLKRHIFTKHKKQKVIINQL